MKNTEGQRQGEEDLTSSEEICEEREQAHDRERWKKMVLTAKRLNGS